MNGVFMQESKSSNVKIAVCLACGDEGDIKRLVSCNTCEDSLVHTYCINGISSGVDHINWICWECSPKASMARWPEPSRKSERLSSRRNKAIEVRQKLKQRLRLNYPKAENLSITTKLGMAVRVQMAKLPVKHKEVENAQVHEEVENAQVREEVENALVAIDGPLEDVLNHGSLSTSTSPRSSDHDDHQNVLPVSHPTWRGCFSIGGINLGIFAHLSTAACPTVNAIASALPPVLDVAILPLSDLWPKSFEMSPPTAGTIGLYFFPEDECAEKVFDGLTIDIIEHELALKVALGDVELLMFSSRELPLEHWRFRMKYYLWGIFRRTCLSESSQEAATEMHIEDENS